MGTRNKWQTSDGAVTLYCGEAAEVLEREGIEADAVVADPPYGLRFMGRRWDYDVPAVRTWEAILAALPPGGHVLSFFGSRTYHRGVVAIEDAGFEIRDQIGWIYGSGFPKSLDVSKAIDKAAGKRRRVVGRKLTPFRVDAAAGRGRALQGSVNGDFSRQTEDGYRYTELTDPATPEAKQWQGWGTALKPAMEPIAVARRPIEGTVAANVLKYGAGALNVDGCRVGTDDTRSVASKTALGILNDDGWKAREVVAGSANGRWPANVAHDGSDEVLALFPRSKSAGGTAAMKPGRIGTFEEKATRPVFNFGDDGSAARFFYCAKTSKADRGDGNNHPTVKPTALMRWLIRLVAPAGAIVLDPFMGSGSTGKAAVAEGVRFVGIERDRDSFRTSIERIKKARRACARPRELVA